MLSSFSSDSEITTTDHLAFPTGLELALAPESTCGEHLIANQAMGEFSSSNIITVDETSVIEQVEPVQMIHLMRQKSIQEGL